VGDDARQASVATPEHAGPPPAGPTDASIPAERAPFERRILWVAGAFFAALMVASPWYGFDRDELYFFDCARHLQASYVDQPVLTPLLARISLDLFGVSLPGLRVWAALAGAATVVVGALIARELGGGRRAQLLTAIAVATMPALLGADHLMGPTAFDLLAWALLALFVLKVERTGDNRWWLAAGTVLGLGLANKHSIGFFALAIFIGALLAGGRRFVLNRWFLAGAAIAVAFTAPDLWWQATHGWATITMTRNLNAENGGAGKVGTWVVGQLIMVTVALVWVWVVGLVSLWRSRRPMRRALVWAYGLLFVFFAATTGGKIYYLAGAYVYLLAAGVVAIEPWLAVRAARIRTLIEGVAVTTVVALPIVLPVLPAADIGWTYNINQVPAESVGWPELVATVRAEWRTLPAAERARTVIFTANYGEAGAINELGRGSGLPTAVSGHNSEWWWGPGNPQATNVLAVAPGPRDVTGYEEYLSQFCASVRPLATLRNTAGLHNQEWGGHVYLCTGLRQPWSATWPLLRDYS
jgi:4-amino-4-deoxy-L-arabinose transferase-like glycosyltransferase